MIIKDIIKNKDYDYIEFREDNIFIGACESINGELISLDGDNYSDNMKVDYFEEWEADNKKGLTIELKIHKSNYVVLTNGYKKYYFNNLKDTLQFYSCNKNRMLPFKLNEEDKKIYKIENELYINDDDFYNKLKYIKITDENNFDFLFKMLEYWGVSNEGLDNIGFYMWNIKLQKWVIWNVDLQKWIV